MKKIDNQKETTMKLVKLALVGIALAISTSSFAVDGYKDLKFGMSLAQVKKSKLCEKGWLELKKDLSYVCFTFKFGKGKSNAIAFFINDKLERIAIPIDGQGSAVSNGLLEKYGKPSSMTEGMPTDGKFPPDSRWDFRFDNDTIIYRAAFDSSGKGSEYLIYTTPDFDNKTMEQEKQTISDDL
jgi:uncharacterized protein HI_1492